MRRASSSFTPNRQRTTLENGEPQTSGRIWFATFWFLCLSVCVFVCACVGFADSFLSPSSGINIMDFAFNQKGGGKSHQTLFIGCLYNGPRLSKATRELCLVTCLKSWCVGLFKWIFSLFSPSHKIAESKCSSGNNPELLHFFSLKTAFQENFFGVLYLFVFHFLSVYVGGEEGGRWIPSVGGRLSVLPSASQEPVRQLRDGDPRPLPPQGEKSNK